MSKPELRFFPSLCRTSITSLEVDKIQFLFQASSNKRKTSRSSNVVTVKVSKKMVGGWVAVKPDTQKCFDAIVEDSVRYDTSGWVRFVQPVFTGPVPHFTQIDASLSRVAKPVIDCVLASTAPFGLARCFISRVDTHLCVNFSLGRAGKCCSI